MKNTYKIGDSVSFTYHILGPVTGTIEHFFPDVSNGQQYALVKVALQLPGHMLCREPVINLRVAA